MVKYSVIFMTYQQIGMFDKYAESVKDYDVEIILSDDGSTDGSKEEALRRGWTVVGNEVNKGFDIITGANEAAKIAKGEYLIYFTGDTYPHPDFIKKIDEHVAPDRLLNGLRLQVDKSGKILANDWRYLKMKHWPWDTVFEVPMADPWEAMQSNGMVIAKELYNSLGGMFIDYRYHAGACDTDLCANAFYRGNKLMIVPEAVCYHIYHKENFDDQYSTNLKAERIKQFQL